MGAKSQQRAENAAERKAGPYLATQRSTRQSVSGATEPEQAVPDGQHRREHVRPVPHRFQQLAVGDGRAVPLRRVRDLAALQRAGDEHEAADPGEPQRGVDVRRQRLPVGVDEDEVVGVVVHPRQHLTGVARDEPHLLRVARRGEPPRATW